MCFYLKHRKCPHLVESVNSGNESPLFSAAFEGKIEAVKILLKHKVCLIIICSFIIYMKQTFSNDPSIDITKL